LKEDVRFLRDLFSSIGRDMLGLRGEVKIEVNNQLQTLQMEGF
jgi:hypothetical protein